MIPGSLRALRITAGKTQAQVGALTGMTQSEVSKFERRGDHRLSLLRKYAEACGAKLEITAEIDGRCSTLRL